MKIQVAVLFGGKSVEHEISVISALQAMNSIPVEKYDIIPVYITKSGEFYTGAPLREINRYRDIPALLGDCVKVAFVPQNGRTAIVRTQNGRTAIVRTPGKKFGNNTVAIPDVAFPIVHGTNVEDGNLQGFLGTLGLPYVGCDVLSSAVGMDKYVMKSVLAAEGIPVLPALRFRASVSMEEIAEKAEAAIGYPLIVKPVNLGSSVGISKVSDREELFTALDLAFTFADVVLLERAVVKLKEINCSVVGDEDGAEASVLEEPVAQDKILSYKDKYMDGGKGGKNSGKSSGMASLKRKIPAEIPDSVAAEVKDLAVARD